MVLSLIGVLGLFFVLIYALKKLNSGIGFVNGNKMKVLDRVTVGREGSLMVVCVAGKLMLIGAAAQVGIFGAYMIALALGFTPAEAGAIGIIGGADGPTSIYVTSKLKQELLGSIAVAAYSYMALVPVIQPPIMKLLTTEAERKIVMKQAREVSKREKIVLKVENFKHDKNSKKPTDFCHLSPIN